MNKVSTIPLLIIMLLPMGCAMKQAQTPQEFRQLAPQISYGKHEIFNINNSYSRAVKNFKMRAEKCLSQKIVETTVNKNTGAKMGEQVLRYTPSLVVNKKITELSVQQDVSGSGMIMGKVPENGMYIFLADLTESGNNTMLDIYRLTYRSTAQMVSAAKNWASGESLDCPDLTK